VTTRFVLDEFDVDFPPLPTWLVVIIVVVVGCSTHAGTLDAARVSAIAGRVIVVRGGIGISDVCHSGMRLEKR